MNRLQEKSTVIDHISRDETKDLITGAVEHAILKVKYWVLLGILSNMVVVAIPLGAFSYQVYIKQDRTERLAQTNFNILDDRKSVIISNDYRIRKLEGYLRTKYDYEAPSNTEIPSIR